MLVAKGASLTFNDKENKFVKDAKLMDSTSINRDVKFHGYAPNNNVNEAKGSVVKISELAIKKNGQK